MGLSNNDTFKKLRVALKLRDDEIVKICALVDFTVTKSELGAVFRNENHEKYMPCGDQLLRNFLDGLIEKVKPVAKNEFNLLEDYAKSIDNIDSLKNKILYNKQNEGDSNV